MNKTKTFTTLSQRVEESMKWIRVIEPEFSISQNSLLTVDITPNQFILARVASVVGYTKNIQIHTSAEGGVAYSLARKISGGSLLFHKIDAGSLDGTAWLSPKENHTHIHLMNLDGLTDYYIQRDSFLACTSQLSITSKVKGLGWGVNGLFNYIVKGRGTLALSNFGGIQQLDLQPGKEYFFHPKHIIAWESHLEPTPIKIETPFSFKPFKTVGKSPNETWQDKLLHYSKESLNWTTSKSIEWTSHSFNGIKRSLVGSMEYHRVVGPGKILLSTRSKSLFDFPSSTERNAEIK